MHFAKLKSAPLTYLLFLWESFQSVSSTIRYFLYGQSIASKEFLQLSKCVSSIVVDSFLFSKVKLPDHKHHFSRLYGQIENF